MRGMRWIGTWAVGLWWCGGFAAGSARGDVKLPAVFGDHMVLQRELRDRVWGWASPGEAVTVAINGQTASTKAGDDGAWAVTLDPMKAGGPYEMTVSGKNTVKFKDVLVGEVWLCSGQSNMEFSVGSSNDGDLVALAAKNPRIRLITVPLVGTQEPKNDFKGHWSRCTPESVRDFSAVGYFFGLRLHQVLGVPIGLIDDSWGGSACEAWVNRDRMAKSGKFDELLKLWESIEKNYPAAKEKFAADVAAWKEAEKKAKAEGKTPPRFPNNPDGLMAGNARPGNIYNGVLKPTIGYGMRGAIWYQGESNAGRAYQYRELFPFMIQNWRDEWGIGDFSFYWVQLADFLGEKPEPGESAWAELREAQTMTRKLPKSGEAVIIDIGEGYDIHPRNKRDVGNRLARLALHRDYGVHLQDGSPTYKSMTKAGNKITLSFSDVGRGLRPFDVNEPLGFAIAGSDRKFVWAKGKVVGNDKVEVWADGVADPVAVRYAWADNPVCNMYNQEGLPMTPFRTDDWPGVTINNK